MKNYNRKKWKWIYYLFLRKAFTARHLLRMTNGVRVWRCFVDFFVSSLVAFVVQNAKLTFHLFVARLVLIIIISGGFLMLEEC
jgi:hypothetical protein